MRGYTFFQGNGDVAGHHVGAAQLENRDSGILLHIRNPDDAQLEIGFTDVMDRRFLSVKGLPAVAISNVADDLVAFPFLHAMAVNENHIRWASITRLIRTVVA